ncbi:zinc ribbon domain-containing protein [Haloplanus halophilus]|uniref:zinc ribbon domain-containing protein n=1 Tax=Haloplanus halophilus TaxID=2949993 RepID=UPI00203CDDA1|nr:hypothetical protein [Haloplanus sp. GDY1]
MTARRWDKWWSNYFLALGVLSVVAMAVLGWVLSQAPSGMGPGSSETIVVVLGVYGVGALLNVGMGLWIRRGSGYAWYAGMGLLVLSILASLAAGASGAVGGAAVSGIGLVLGYLARDDLLESKSAPAADESGERRGTEPTGEGASERQQASERGGPEPQQASEHRQPERQQGRGTASADAGAGSPNRSGSSGSPASESGGGRPASAAAGGEESASPNAADDGGTKFCPYCGEEIPEKAGHCPYCSSSVQ